MPFFDLPLGELELYRPELAQPNDFDDFWSRTLRQAGEIDLNVRAQLEAGSAWPLQPLRTVSPQS